MIEDWKAEFYPVDADEFKDSIDYVGAIKHSLKKWRGLTKENLVKYSVETIKGDSGIVDAEGTRIGIDSTTCALCCLDIGCVLCPIYTATNGDCSDEYSAWSRRKDPSPMISLLEDVLERYKEK